MEVKIKNITVSVEGQEFSFSGKSLVEDNVYDPATDPEVQGKGLEQAEVPPADIAPAPEVPTELEMPTATPEPVEAPAEVVPTE